MFIKETFVNRDLDSIFSESEPYETWTDDSTQHLLRRRPLLASHTDTWLVEPGQSRCYRSADRNHNGNKGIYNAERPHSHDSSRGPTIPGTDSPKSLRSIYPNRRQKLYGRKPNRSRQNGGRPTHRSVAPRRIQHRSRLGRHAAQPTHPSQTSKQGPQNRNRQPPIHQHVRQTPAPQRRQGPTHRTDRTR